MAHTKKGIVDENSYSDFDKSKKVKYADDQSGLVAAEDEKHMLENPTEISE